MQPGNGVLCRDDGAFLPRRQLRSVLAGEYETPIDLT
jgi:hypothetical protein